MFRAYCDTQKVGTPLADHITDDDTQAWDGLLFSWLLALQAERKATKTIESYRLAPIQLAAWLHDHNQPDTLDQLTPDNIRGWLTHLAATRSDETSRGRYVGLRQWVTWLLAEGELDTDPMGNIRQPKVTPKRVHALTADQQRTLLADCASNTFADLRDRAIILLFMDTGMRASGLADLREPDLDLRERTAAIRLKGGREHVVPYGAATAKALDRYLRAKRRHRYGDRAWLWLSTNNKGRLTKNGIQQMLRRRGTRLGIHLHPHLFRHTFADTWLRAGGGETDLMELAGWQSRQMVGRHAAATRADRAREAHRRLSPMDNL